MSSIASGAEWHTKTVCAWQLALLRFAVTLDNADRLAVLAITAEMDRLHPVQDGKPAFGFFRRTSAELCAAILQPNEHSSALLRQFLARIDDDRLRRAFAATIEAEKVASTSKSIRRDGGLWRGLSTRDNQAL